MIPGKRALLANLVFSTGAYRGLRCFEPKSLVIINYHRIRSDGQGMNPFDDSVFGPTQSVLHEHLRWLKANAEVIGEPELLEHVSRRKKLPRSAVMVTFDDGYRDNAELAMPVLTDLGIPATFFISTRAIETRELGWWDLIAYLVKHTSRQEFALRGVRFDLERGRHRAVATIQDWTRKKPAPETCTLIDELSVACGVPIPPVEVSGRELLDWDQVRSMRSLGMTIGSHTHTHRVLSTLSSAEQFEEFRLSKEILERELGAPVHSVAYPVGGHHDVHLETGSLARMCGYRLGFSFRTGANRLDAIRPFGICRISAEDTLPLMCASVTLPSIFSRSVYRNQPVRALFPPVVRQTQEGLS